MGWWYSSDAKWNHLLLPVFRGGRLIIGGVGSLVAYSSLLLHVTVQLQVTSELLIMEPYACHNELHL